MKVEIDRLRTEFESKLKSGVFPFSNHLNLCVPCAYVCPAESDRIAADARVQQAEARAADLEKFIDKERLLYSDKIRALEATILQNKSDLQDTKRSHHRLRASEHLQFALERLRSRLLSPQPLRKCSYNDPCIIAHWYHRCCRGRTQW